MTFGGQDAIRSLRAAAGVGQIDRRFLTTLECAKHFALALTLSFARVSGGGSPFAMALTACSGCGLNGVSALAGAAIGYLISGGMEWGIRYIAATVLVYTVSFVFHEVSISKSTFFMPLCAGAVMTLTGLLGSFSLAAGEVPPMAKLFLETALAFGGCYFFAEALSRDMLLTESDELRHTVSVMVLISALLMSLSGIVVYNTVSAGRVLALIVLMASAMKGGMLSGAAVGTVLGIAMDSSAAGTPFYTMAYAFSGLLSGVFGRHGRLLFVLSFILSGAVAVVCGWSESIYTSMLFEIFAASVIFMLLPYGLIVGLSLMLDGARERGSEAALRLFVAGKVKGLSDAYGELYDTVSKSISGSNNDENIAAVFDRAADKVCINCKEKNRCWNAEYMDTLSAMNDATCAMRKNGSLRAEDIPGHFRDRCRDIGGFVSAVNGELRSVAYRRELMEAMNENRAIAWGQYLDMSRQLSSLSAELTGLNSTDAPAEHRLLRYLNSIDVDADVSVYRDGGGRLRAVIESGRLSPLTGREGYLEQLSRIVGVRLCEGSGNEEGSGRLTLLEAEPLAVSVGIAAMKKKGEKVSGDRGSYFKNDSGVLFIILSDGMGTGDSAAAISSRVVMILEKFLRSGSDPAVAMKVLNSVMLLRGSDEKGFATVDLVCIDLFSGETCFYKYGAAPSYVKNGRTVKRIKGDTLAAGLSVGGGGTAPDVVRMKLSPGCTAMIASDGVSCGDDEWLRELLLTDNSDMKALARLAVREAEKRSGASDDMTVVTVRVEERK